MTGVVEIVADMPCCSVGAWRASHRGYGHRVPEVWFRGRGSGETLIALEACALVKTGIAPETRSSGETESVLET